MFEFNYRITDERGFHVQPAVALAQYVKNSGCNVYIEKNRTAVNMERIMEVISLQISKGDMIHVVVSGDNEETVYNYVKSYFYKNL